MRIENLRIETQSDRARAAARLIWEDTEREPQEIYFETRGEFSDSVSANPHAFLVAGTIAALRHGERRIALDAAICPELKLGLMTAARLLQFWCGSDRPPIKIESKEQRRSKPQKRRRAAFCFTGGVDSLATLRTNRLNFHPDDAGYIRDGVLIFGLEVERLESFQCVTDVLARLASEDGFTMVPVYTNVQDLDKNWTFWTDEFEAAVLASVGHALSERIETLMIGSSFDFAWLHPHGSHPLLDPNYSSNDVRIRHDGTALSRLEKTHLIAEWPQALRALRVCNRTEMYQPEVVNCGTCEKCLRTLTALLIAGRLDALSTFRQREVTPELIAMHAQLDDTSFPFWSELAGPLRERGRDALADAVDEAISRYRGELGFTGALRRIDRVHLHGSLRAVKHAAVDRTRALRGLLGAVSALGFAHGSSGDFSSWGTEWLDAGAAVLRAAM
jgi:hypothetical protein